MSNGPLRIAGIAGLLALVTAPCASADVVMYGDQDMLGTGPYSSDPVEGATLEGLAPGVVTFADLISTHDWPFDPEPDDYPGTDQIYVGSNQTRSRDGYSRYAGRVNGPQIIEMEYSALVPQGHSIETFTLGIAADDFEYPLWHQPFEAKINGVRDEALTAQLNALSQTFVYVQFFTIGLDPDVLLPGHLLTLSIDEGGDGGDGWAVDFLSVGVTTTPIPSPGVLALLGMMLVARRRARA